MTMWMSSEMAEDCHLCREASTERAKFLHQPGTSETILSFVKIGIVEVPVVVAIKFGKFQRTWPCWAMLWPCWVQMLGPNVWAMLWPCCCHVVAVLGPNVGAMLWPCCGCVVAVLGPNIGANCCGRIGSKCWGQLLWPYWAQMLGPNVGAMLWPCCGHVVAVLGPNVVAMLGPCWVQMLWPCCGRDTLLEVDSERVTPIELDQRSLQPKMVQCCNHDSNGCIAWFAFRLDLQANFWCLVINLELCIIRNHLCNTPGK